MLKTIGLGSPFGDDSVGLLVIEALQQEERLQPYLGDRLELIAADRPGPALLTHFEDAESAIIIDAVISGAPLGQLHTWSDANVVENSSAHCSSHGFGLAQTLALGRQLDMLPEALTIFGIEIDVAGNNVEGTLSEPVRRRLPYLIKTVSDEIYARLVLFQSD